MNIIDFMGSKVWVTRDGERFKLDGHFEYREPDGVSSIILRRDANIKVGDMVFDERGMRNVVVKLITDEERGGNLYSLAFY